MQTNCNAYTADVVVLYFIGDNITLYLKISKSDRKYTMGDCLKNLFVQDQLAIS